MGERGRGAILRPTILGLMAPATVGLIGARYAMFGAERIQRSRGWTVVLAPLLRGRGPRAVFARGVVLALLISGGGRVVSFPLNVAIARALGVEGFGAYSYVLNWIGMLSLVLLMGLQVSVVRFIAEYRSTGDWPRLRGLLRRTVEIATLSGVLAGIALASIAWALRERMGDELFLAFLMGSALLPLLILDHLRAGLLRGFRRVGWALALSQLAKPLVLGGFVVGAFVLVGGRVSAAATIGLEIGATLIVLGAGTLVLRRALPKEARGVRPAYATREWLRVSMPLVAGQGMRTILSYGDVLLIGLLLGPAPVAIYVVAARIGRFTELGVTAANAVAQPLIAELHASGDRRQLQRLVTAATWGGTLLAGGIGLVLILLREPLLAVFGEPFSAGGTALIIIVLAYVVDAWTGAAGSILNMTGHQDRNAIVLATSAAVNVAANVPAILIAGIEGAAIVTLCSLALRSVWQWRLARRSPGIDASIFGPVPWAR